MYKHFGKRLLDVLLALFGLVILMPLWLIVILAIVVESPGNPFFVQYRVGLKGRKFPLIKFRSMIPDAWKTGKGFGFDGDADTRITRCGRFIRKTSIDELPELLNVLVGNMSLVGPRPMLPYQFEYMSPEQRRRFEVRPGITGLAQVSGRTSIPWTKRFEHDLRYVERLSLGTDLWIMMQTVRHAVAGKDVEYPASLEQVEDFIPRKGGSHS